MFSFIKRLLLIAALCVPWVTQAQGTAITSFPFTCDFEDASDNAYWSFQNASNGWYIGTAVNHGGTHALYVGESSASSNSYNAMKESRSSGNRSVAGAFKISISLRTHR